MTDSVGARVVARVRPPTRGGSSSACLAVLGRSIRVPEHNVDVRLTSVLGPDASQEDVFSSIEAQLREPLRGLTSTVLTYGQTGSGKSHTLLGTVAAPGIAPRTCALLGEALAGDASLSVSMSMVELYCERLQDLLGAGEAELSIQRDVRGFHVAGARIEAVRCAEDMKRCIAAGLERRVIRKTGMNAESSRSHLLIYVFLARREPGGSVVHSKLCLADLAGSERQSKAGTATASLAEGCAINKSLSALGNVLTALTEASGPEPLSGAHVPFRDSKLTRLLQDCLGGSALMTLVVCVSPDPEQAQETVSTLRFGSRALGIQSVVKVVKQVSLASLSAERDRLAALVEELRAQKAPSLVEATTRSAVSTRRASHVERMRDMLLLTVLLSQATYLVLSRLGLSLLGF